MTEEARFLLACLRQTSPAIPDSLDWPALLQLAESHGVLPLFHRSCPGDLPPEFLQHFRDRWALSLFLARELDELLEQFEEHQIRVLPLKGPVLADLLYGQIGLRPSDDLDLLVRPEDYARAEALLFELGFTPLGEADDYHRDFGRNGTFVELHFGVASPSALRFDVEGAWDRARTVPFRSREVLFFSPVDLILYLSLHGVKHGFAKLIWVVDMVRALERLTEAEACNLVDEAAAQGLKNLLLMSCQVARHTFGVCLPAQGVLAIERNPGLAKSAETMADAILSVPADPTTSVYDASRYLELADNSGRRWRQRLQFFVPTRRDYQWVARYHIPAGCAVVVRPFRLLLAHGPASALRTLFGQSLRRG
ncbi:MAG TPA: nucleotidyltransferase family protein [Acidobacteriaceae bacterium]|nr:nucleotidyltransferase family protein [Acidobacteriaceae bacterium]